jgi:hypothetical protein
MEPSRFDKNDPFHACVWMLMQIDCSRCSAELGCREVSVGDDFGDQFLEFCVAVSDRARAEGWQHQQEWWDFLCPACAAAAARVRDNSSTLQRTEGGPALR